MGSYPINPRTGRREPPAFADFGKVVVDIVAVLVLGFIGFTIIAALLYGCVAMWLLMLA